MDEDCEGIPEGASEWPVARIEVPKEELDIAIGPFELVEFDIGKGGTMMVGPRDARLEVPREGRIVTRLCGLVDLTARDVEKAVKSMILFFDLPQNGKVYVAANSVSSTLKYPRCSPCLEFE